MTSALPGFSRRSFSVGIGGRTIAHDVYERAPAEGRARAPVVLIQELPGIGPEVLRLADRLVEAGHRVVLPHLFGPLGRTAMVGNLGRVMCMRREFRLLARNESGPIVDWLRALCREVREQYAVEGVGVIGMCLTGNFALTLVGDESVLAAVASQPSMPVVPQGSLQMRPSEIEAARLRLDEHGPMLAFRFEHDVLCSARKFEAIDRAFNDDRERVRLSTLPGRGHAVLTVHFVDEAGHPTRQALDQVLAYFAERLPG
jgi:dienelactone hydrolase